MAQLARKDAHTRDPGCAVDGNIKGIAMRFSIGEQKANYCTASRIIKTMRFRSWLAAIATILLLFPSSPAWAWGSEGHRVIADIAWDHLNDATLASLRQFLGNNDLASISTWADDIRSGRPETGPWHFVDIPPNSAYDAKYCPDDNCIVAQINRFVAILGDPKQPFAARSEALKFVVHFVGDLSQPFHAMADARGGNDVPVSVFGATQCGDYPCNLHSVWDSELILHTGLREHRYARELEEMIAKDHLRPGSADPVVWANDSLALAKQAWVQPQTNIDEAYYLRERPVVDRQLALAGLRLARLLNEELGDDVKS
jgi:nuclease S1